MANRHGKKSSAPSEAQLWREGQAAFRAGRYGAAIKAWKSLAHTPSGKKALTEAYYRRGVLTQTFGDLETAHAYAQDDSRVVLAMVRLFVRQGEYAKAWKLVQGSAGDLVAPKTKAAVAALVGATGSEVTAPTLRALGVMAVCKQALPDDDRRWPAWVRALLLAGHRVVGDATPDGDEAPAMPKAGPKPARALAGLYSLVTAAQDGRNFPSPQEIGSLSVESLPESVRPLLRWLVRRVVAYSALAGDPVAALALAERFADFMDAKELSAIRVRAGDVQYAAGNAEAALASWEQARSHFPLDQPIAVALERQDPKRAIPAWERAVRSEERRLGPDRRADLSGLYLHVAHLAASLSEPEIAVSYFDRGFKWAASRPSPEAYGEFAATLEEIGAPNERQIEAWRMYLEGAPTDVGAVQRLTGLLVGMGKFQEAFDAVADVAGEMTPDRLSAFTADLYFMSAFSSLYGLGNGRAARELEDVAKRFSIAEQITAPFMAHALLDEDQPQAARRVLETAPRTTLPRSGRDSEDTFEQRLMAVAGWAWMRLGDDKPAEALFKAATGQRNHEDTHVAAIIAQMLCVTHLERTHQHSSCGQDPVFNAAIRWLERAKEGQMCAVEEIDYDRIRCRNFRDAVYDRLLRDGMSALMGQFQDLFRDD